MFAEQIEHIIGVFHSLGLIALLVMAYGMTMRLTVGMRGRKVLTGVIFGLGSVVSMLDPLVLAPGIQFDGRNILIALAGPFGGVWASFITAMIVICFRIWEGGAGVESGIVAACIAAVIGSAFAIWHKRRPVTQRDLFVLSISLSSVLASCFALPPEYVLPILAKVAMPVILANLIGVNLAGFFLAREASLIGHEHVLEEQAQTDPLTKLANRRAFDEFAPGLAQTASARGNAYSILLIDVDRFKSINDTYGHQAGDAVLAEVARIIERNARGVDLVARYGGEELVVLMPRTATNEAALVADRMRSQIEEAAIVIDGHAIPVTISVGVCTALPGSDGIAPTLRAADQALYAAKERGRNRVEVARERMAA